AVVPAATTPPPSIPPLKGEGGEGTDTSGQVQSEHPPLKGEGSRSAGVHQAEAFAHGEAGDQHHGDSGKAGSEAEPDANAAPADDKAENPGQRKPDGPIA